MRRRQTPCRWHVSDLRAENESGDGAAKNVHEIEEIARRVGISQRVCCLLCYLFHIISLYLCRHSYPPRLPFNHDHRMNAYTHTFSLRSWPVIRYGISTTTSSKPKRCTPATPQATLAADVPLYIKVLYVGCKHCSKVRRDVWSRRPRSTACVRVVKGGRRKGRRG